jgi:broad specificity phosphatase PhoE
MNLVSPFIRDRTVKRQLIGVVRHAERADATWSACAKDNWYHTEDCRRFPADPPVSEHGLREAEAIGQVVHDWVKECSDQLHNIISSPYLRCVQTAAKICKELGPTSRIIIDYCLAEVHSPDIVGEAGGKEGGTTRPFKDIQVYCKLHGVRCREATMGAMPAWPESVRSAKKRFARRFLEYLQWSLESDQNFIFVSHADCVQATLALMPSQEETGHTVLNVEFGGFFSGK